MAEGEARSRSIERHLFREEFAADVLVLTNQVMASGKRPIMVVALSERATTAA
ncbi:hypothetical protein ACIRJR_14185 [Streptomyces sp. NPDC102402]|uniref:hypothetical protein n=1 Tax=Streptomyces sp. NPDC102402 TaxID=3366169 RepID=UPI0038276D66